MRIQLQPVVSAVLLAITFGDPSMRPPHSLVPQTAAKGPSASAKTRSFSTTFKREGRAWGGERDRDFHVAPLVVPGGRLLVTARDTLYMLSESKKRMWRFYVGAPVIDKLVLDSSGMIHGIAMDGIRFAVDLDGNRRWTHRMNGRANYSQICPYGGDQQLVVINTSAYREGLTYDALPDRLVMYRGRKSIWARDFPRDAELYVWDRRIVAVRQTRSGTTLVELGSPR